MNTGDICQRFWYSINPSDAESWHDALSEPMVFVYYCAIGLLIVCQVLFFIFAKALHEKFSWKVFNRVGGDKLLTSKYPLFGPFSALLVAILAPVPYPSFKFFSPPSKSKNRALLNLREL